MRKRKVRWRKILAVITLAAIGYIAYTAIGIARYSNVDETCVAGAAIVLGAGVWDDKPSPVFEERIKHAIWLYENNYTDILIFTGGTGEGKQYSEASVAKRYAMQCGLPENKIFIEEQSVITQQNLEYAAAILQKQNISSALIVSDPLHMKRAMLLANDYLPAQAYSSPTGTSKYTSFGAKAEFLAREVFFYIGYQFYRIPG